ncbi:hypothetical protein G6O69_25055 [Pseudenhygromyxa sp. WMMC2535]|uniref:hypothetical protein n=1 Tax=Pseudenhygromyxa sp. WMMC2535 TaxID=2712867 RepID=UPI0015528331|nr:hypothetical protein [Pseudenhygromyxa sp. WMMC2535]NVB41133.1 hypothetical protein [Pseudenhygromyxa sp. WMMC2535]
MLEAKGLDGIDLPPVGTLDTIDLAVALYVLAPPLDGEPIRERAKSIEQELSLTRALLADLGEDFDVVAEREVVEIERRTEGLWTRIFERLRASRSALFDELFPPMSRFMRPSFGEQAALLSEILVRCEGRDGQAASPAELIGPELLAALRAWAPAYAALVSSELWTLRGGRELQARRARLRRVIGRYTSSVNSAARPEQPERLAMVRAGLEPLDELRARIDAGEL